MPQWIAFDEATAQALHARNRNPDLRPGDPLQALTDQDRAVLLLPGGRGTVLLIRSRRAEASPDPEPLAVARWEDKEAIGYRAGGLLGLHDEPVYEEEKPKKWWQKLLD